MSVIEERRERERRGSRRIVGTVIAIGLASLAVLVAAPAAGASNDGGAWAPAVAIEPFSGDVFTIGSNGNLIAVDPRYTPDSAALFNAQGDPLNLTWGQWSSATATSLAKTATEDGVDYTDLKITLSGLIPNGVYSLFYDTFGPDSANPVCGATEPLVALTARHPERQTPDADSFIANSSGAASFDGRVPGRLLDAQNFLIAVIYHFDGNVYGPVPNYGEANNNCNSSFGIDAIRQFLIAQK